MQDSNAQAAQATIARAINYANEMNPQKTDGIWLEDLTVRFGPYIKEWDIAHCYHWSEWPERETYFPGSTQQDVGIDAVAIRRSDGAAIAIQCKARELDASGRGDDIHKVEVDKFIAASVNAIYTERWLVTNGDNQVGANTRRVMEMSDPKRPIKLINIHADLLAQQSITASEPCPHCQPNPDPDNPDLDGTEEPKQTKSCMQAEAIAASVRILKEHEASDSGGLPQGQARGRIILPCGTGKTRISLRIVEQLTPPGALSIVLCPSIALVAQIRREYLQYAELDLRALAVCSDDTAGYDPKKESARNTAADPTQDNSNVSAAEVKGKVTTDPEEIARWIRDGQGAGPVNVIFGTYQSGHRIAEALKKTGVTAQVLIADEAHRTAGLRRKRNARNGELSDEEKRIRDFTLCHDNAAFPARYRIYQTATPRIYDVRRVNREQAGDWIVRTMDDETVFGVELYRKSYTEAVRNGWLADYRIIAVGINDPEAYKQANEMTKAINNDNNNEKKGRNQPSVTNYLRGLAFALALNGAAYSRDQQDIPIQSCIAFMNTVEHSKKMVENLKSKAVQKWVKNWLYDNRNQKAALPYTLEHLDATSNVIARENAKRRLAEADGDNPHAVINVGIFGEGTDAPSLSAVAFLEPRKSPIDVIQAVGRAMRTAPGKEMGYVICPLLIPPKANPEQWLSVSDMDEGWQELGQVLLALRAHDERIENNLADLLQLYLPIPPEEQRTIIAIATAADRSSDTGDTGDQPDIRIHYREHLGPPGAAQQAIQRVLENRSTMRQEFHPLNPNPEPGEEPTLIMSGKKNPDGTLELRMDTVIRAKPKPDGSPGSVDFNKSRSHARRMINNGVGPLIPPEPGPSPVPPPPKDKTEKEKDKSETQGGQGRMTHEERVEKFNQWMLDFTGANEHGNAIRMNLLAKSGLVDNRVVRDLNILETSIKEAAHHLNDDELRATLDRHFGLDNLKDTDLNKQADGCTIAALLLMNAAMLHQRIASGRWLRDVSDLETVKNAVNVIRQIEREWNRILQYDFRPVIEPALKAIHAIEDTGKLAGLERALRHLAAEAERIAETYADMGADHAGPLFNRVMGNQASDGAFFTRPVAASIAARLTLDAAGNQDWTKSEVWQAQRTVDLACGSGTLLAAILTDQKRRAREQGANARQIADLQQLAVEETIKGLDINPVSLQLAASQLTAGNQEIRYRKMGLYQMPYGPLSSDDPTRVAAGTLELLGQQAIVARASELNLPDDKIAAQSTWKPDDAELEDAVAAVKDARIVIMNPPFTSRRKMGEKFPPEIKEALRSRADAMERILLRADPSLVEFADKNSVRPLFVALADRIQKSPDGVVSMINPTIALSATSGLKERQILAERFHIHTILTCHQPGNINLSQNTNINESIVVMRRHAAGPKPPTRLIHLDKLPVDENDVADLHQCLLDCRQGQMVNGWGEISQWPAARMEQGDWTPAVWRSPELSEAAQQFAAHPKMRTIQEHGYSCEATRQMMDKKNFIPATPGNKGSFPIIDSKGGDGQKTIRSTPDAQWQPTNPNEEQRIRNGGTYPQVQRLLSKAGFLLITSGQDTSTARLTAIANDQAYVGRGWLPITGPDAEEAKAMAVFLNSTAGRLQLLRNAGRKLAFPQYNPEPLEGIRIPDLKDGGVRQTLAECWERTKEWAVPQYREGECEVRRVWDEAVAQALGWEAADLTRLRHLLHQEPHVRGLGYNQWGDAGEGDGDDDTDDLEAG